MNIGISCADTLSPSTTSQYGPRRIEYIGLGDNNRIYEFLYPFQNFISHRIEFRNG